jgi:hypothetical protein
MSDRDLTTLSNVKSYLAIDKPNQDNLIRALISRESQTIVTFLSRDIFGVDRTLYPCNGSGTSVLALPETPALTVSAVKVLNTDIPFSTDGVAAGYTFDENAVYLIGSVFPKGRRNVFVSWKSGYVGTDTEFIPAGTKPVLKPTDTGRPLVPLQSIFVDTGAALTLVMASPAAGQFTFDEGAYEFNPADSGRQVELTYQCVPPAIEQACIEMVGLDLKQRDNLGISSKNLAGESISYTSKGMTDSVKEMLSPYRRRWVV